MTFSSTRDPVEQAEPLQGAGDAEAGQLVRAQAGARRRRAGRASGVGRDEAAGDVEQRGLAGAVGPDHAVHLVRGDGEADVGEGGDPAEGHGDAAELELSACRPCCPSENLPTR